MRALHRRSQPADVWRVHWVPGRRAHHELL